MGNETESPSPEEKSLELFPITFSNAHLWASDKLMRTSEAFEHEGKNTSNCTQIKFLKWPSMTSRTDNELRRRKNVWRVGADDELDSFLVDIPSECEEESEAYYRE